MHLGECNELGSPCSHSLSLSIQPKAEPHCAMYEVKKAFEQKKWQEIFVLCIWIKLEATGHANDWSFLIAKFFSPKVFLWSRGSASVNTELLGSLYEKDPKQSTEELEKIILVTIHRFGKVSQFGKWLPRPLIISYVNQRLDLSSSLKSKLVT